MRPVCLCDLFFCVLLPENGRAVRFYFGPRYGSRKNSNPNRPPC